MNPSPAPANPLTDLPPPEVPLKSAPLVRVMAQIKFSEVLGVENPEVVARFQDAISKTYSVLTREAGIVMPTVFPGMSPQHPMTHWRFADSAVDWQWRVTLTSQFITLEVVRYTSRREFFGRLEAILGAVELHIKPAMAVRLGVRYINRITGKELEDASLLVRPEIAGVVGTEMAAAVSLSLSESVFNMGDQRMTARWGMLPANATVDPAAIEPIQERCFLLDLDVYDESPGVFDAHSIAQRGLQFAERSYTFFRWAVTPEFLRRFGAES